MIDAPIMTELSKVETLTKTKTIKDKYSSSSISGVMTTKVFLIFSIPLGKEMKPDSASRITN